MRFPVVLLSVPAPPFPPTLANILPNPSPPQSPTPLTSLCLMMGMEASPISQGCPTNVSTKRKIYILHLASYETIGKLELGTFTSEVVYSIKFKHTISECVKHKTACKPVQNVFHSFDCQ